ncbi:calmodulin-related [Lithospermum erythrorhizon]|uniref:Calmodulin-related n=1 Tax=Lithospermum erythrorhizon TaxID=34254 RepID=A0AAV3PUY1_LITER
MSVAIIDGPTVTDFVNDSEAFEKCVNEKFQVFDLDGDGVLSREELERRGSKVGSSEHELQSGDEIASLYDILFEKFDGNQSGTIDRDEFGSLMKEIMLAKARGIGNSPISIILQGDSLLMRAVQRRSAINH